MSNKYPVKQVLCHNNGRQGVGHNVPLADKLMILFINIVFSKFTYCML